MNRLLAYLKRDGWIIAALAVCAALCLAMGAAGNGQSGESRVSRVLSAISGAGKVDVAVWYEDSVPCAAVVVADGASDVGVRIDLTSAVTRLLGIAQERVAVYPREVQ